MTTVNRRSAFTLVELLVVIGIIALLISILLPTLGRAREQANMIKCLSNLRQIGQAISQYSNAYKGYIVPGSVRTATSDAAEGRDNWATILVGLKYLTTPPQVRADVNNYTNTSFGDSVFRCPNGLDLRNAGGSPTPNSMESDNNSLFFRILSATPEGIIPDTRIDIWYGINGWAVTDGNQTNMKNAYIRFPFTSWPEPVSPPQGLHKFSHFRSPVTLVLVYDGLQFHSQRLNYVSARHNKKKFTNMLFADFHAESVQAVDVKKCGTDLKTWQANSPRMMIDKP